MSTDQLDVDHEPAVGTVITDGFDNWLRDLEGWWLLDGHLQKLFPYEPPADWGQLLDGGFDLRLRNPA